MRSLSPCADAAGACGVACIGVRSGGIADADLRSAGASAVYDDVADLVGSLDGSPLAAILTPR